MEPENAERLRNWRRFVIWTYDGKKKVPLDPATGRKTDCSNRGVWMDFETARREKLKCRSAVGIGFVLDDTPFCLVDFDRCIRNKEVSRLAADVLGRLHGVEEGSVSGEGMHALIQAEKPGSQCVRKKPGREIEIYDRERFVAIADESIVDKPVPKRQTELEALYHEIFPQVSLEDVAANVEAVNVPDEALLEKARNATSTGNQFRKLFDHGDVSDYPSRSEAHFDLCRMLGFWTGGDMKQVERMFWESALAGTVERTDPESYVRRTLRKAVASLTKFYEPGMESSMKERVKELAERHIEWIAGLAWSYRGGETLRAVYTDVTRHAGEWAYPADGGALDFNVNQQAIADRVGVGQWTVSKSLQKLVEKGLLIRLSKGHTGRNSYYRLPLPSADTTTMSQQGSGGSATTTMNHPPVKIHISDNDTNLRIHVSGGSSDSEPEPLPEENPEPDGLPEVENAPEVDEDGWEDVG